MTLRYDEPADPTKPPVATELVGDDHYQLIKLIDPTPASTTPAGTVANPHRVKDDFVGGEVLAEQSGAGAVLTFAFASAVNLVIVESFGDGVVSRAEPFGGTPTAALGWPCRHEVPQYLPVITSVVKVFAPSGATVNVIGYRR